MYYFIKNLKVRSTYVNIKIEKLIIKIKRVGENLITENCIYYQIYSPYSKEIFNLICFRLKIVDK